MSRHRPRYSRAADARRASHLSRRVDRSCEILTKRRVPADDRIPRHLGSVTASLRNDLYALGRDRDRIDLTFVFQFSLDALVEFRCHGSVGSGVRVYRGRSKVIRISKIGIQNHPESDLQADPKCTGGDIEQKRIPTIEIANNDSALRRCLRGNHGEYRSATLNPAYMPIPVPTMLSMKAVMNPIPDPAAQPNEPPMVVPIITQSFFIMVRRVVGLSKRALLTS